MALTPEQREKRKTKIGSSDAAAVLGFSEYRSPYDVWLEKTGKADGFGGNEATERGSFLEPAVLAWAERKLGRTLSRDQYAERGNLCCNFDALVRSGECAIAKASVEAKTSVMIEKFGDAGSDVIPEEYLVQVHHGRILIPTLEVAYVPVLVAGYKLLEFRMYEVALDPNVADGIGERLEDFWEKHVKRDVPPDGWRPSLEVLKRVKREPKTVCDVADDLVQLWTDANENAKRAKKDLEQAQVDLIAALGTNEAGRCSLGLVTYLETTRKAYAVEAATYRQLRLKGAK